MENILRYQRGEAACCKGALYHPMKQKEKWDDKQTVEAMFIISISISCTALRNNSLAIKAE